MVQNAPYKMVTWRSPLCRVVCQSPPRNHCAFDGSFHLAKTQPLLSRVPRPTLEQILELQSPLQRL